MSTTFNMFDLIFIFLAIIFLVIAFFRGFVKEIFSLINWILTILAVYFLSPFLADLILSYSKNKAVANISAYSITFILVFIVLALATKNISESCKNKISTNLDKILGIVYAFLKIFLVFGLTYAFIINIYAVLLGLEHKIKSKKDSMPSWLYDAKCRPYIEPFGKAFNPLVKKLVSETNKNFTNEEENEKTLEEKIDEITKEEDSKEVIKEKKVEEKNNIKKKPDAKYEEKGYSKKEIEKMNHLIEIVE